MANEEMKEVTRQEFFAILNSYEEDIMPRNTDPTYSNWENQHTRALFGRTYLGWKNPGDPKKYFVHSRYWKEVPLGTQESKTRDLG